MRHTVGGEFEVWLFSLRLQISQQAIEGLLVGIVILSTNIPDSTRSPVLVDLKAAVTHQALICMRVLRDSTVGVFISSRAHRLPGNILNFALAGRAILDIGLRSGFVRHISPFPPFLN